MGSLSLCMIVKNEENNLAACLKQIRKVVDEIIIVDTGSTDSTVKVAKRLGAKVYFFKWCDDFSAARNESLKHAKCDYIIWLDADDRIKKREVKKLLELKKLLPENKDTAYALKIVNLRNSFAESCYQMRIFPNLPQLRFEGAVHEQISLAAQRLGLKTEFLDIEIIHLGYNKPEVNQKKAERNLKLLLKELEKNPKCWSTHFFLGQTYKFLGDKENAVFHLRKVIELESYKDNMFMYIAAGINLACLLDELGQREKAFKTLIELAQKFPQNDMVKFFLGQLYVAEKQYEKALNALIGVNPNNLHLVVIPIAQETLQFKYYVNLATCYENLGYLKLAKDAYEKGLRLIGKQNESPEFLARLGVFYFKLSDFGKAKKILNKAISLAQGELKATLYHLLGQILIKTGEKRKAKKHLEMALQYNGKILPALILAYLYAEECEVEKCVKMAEKTMKALNMPVNLILNDMLDLIALFTEIAEKCKQKQKREEAVWAYKVAEKLLQYLQNFSEHLRQKADINM